MSSPLPPPGWYHDHSSGQWLWWDGRQWTLPMVEAAPAPVDATGTWFPRTPTLAFPAAIVGIAFIVLLTVGSRMATLLPETPEAIVSLALFASSTLGMPALAILGSRRWGSGRVFDDLGLRFRWVDLPLGIAAAVVITIAVIVVNIASQLVGVPNGSNLTEVAKEGRDGALFVVVFVQAGLIAPATEELLFRGLIMRGLDSRMSVWVAVGLQALVFGSAHLTPSEGWGNFDLVSTLAVAGLGLGVTARLTGRLGTPILAHAGFNCIQLGLLWLSLGR